MDLDRDEIYGPVSDLLEENDFEHIAEYLKEALVSQTYRKNERLQWLRKWRITHRDNPEIVEQVDKMIGQLHNQLGLPKYKPPRNVPRPQSSIDPREAVAELAGSIVRQERLQALLERFDRENAERNCVPPRYEGVVPLAYRLLKEKTLSLLGVDKPS